MKKAHAQHRLHPKRLGYFRKETTKASNTFFFLCINRRPGSSRHSQSQVSLVANHKSTTLSVLSLLQLLFIIITKAGKYMTSLYYCLLLLCNLLKKTVGKRYFYSWREKKTRWHCKKHQKVANHPHTLCPFMVWGP